MKKWKLIFPLLLLLSAATAIYLGVNHPKALVMQPQGIIASSEAKLIKINIGLMLLIVFPTLFLIYFFILKYQANNKNAKYEPEKTGGPIANIIIWAIPSALVIVMSIITWKATHKLDPYRPLEGEGKPLTIQVVAINWKWLFIYPEQGIATVNFIQFPARTPIHFELTADNSPMNSFWIPQLSGQIYTMSGMTTQLHLMADEPGVYSGRAAEINGEGLADMTFVVKSSTEEDFEAWVKKVKQSPLQLNDQSYDQLLKPSVNNPVTLYSNVEKDLFNKIVMKYMYMK